MDLERAESESNEFAYLLSDLISIKSQKYTTPNLSGHEVTDVYGVTRVHSNLVLKWNVEADLVE